MTIHTYQAGSFAPENHWYPKALNAQLHPLVSFFLNLSTQRVIKRYCHLHPGVESDLLEELLHYKPRHFYWSGTDLFHVTSIGAKKQLVVVETNSCPSGQKSMPLKNEHQEYGGYLDLIEHSFRFFLKGKRLYPGALAVIYDKNPMEASGYASAMAEAFQEPVHLIPWFNGEENTHIQVKEDQIHAKIDGEWTPIRAAFRYLTQKPWNRLPISNRTQVFNPVIACLAGGRNKLVAAKAYEFFNAELKGSGLYINTPQTVWDVDQTEIPLWVKRFGGQAVIKVPYSNAGQGVFTITSEAELDDFMKMEFDYDLFIVQSLIGNYHWSSTTERGKFYHVGTVPDKQGRSYVADLRFMIQATEQGFKPVGLYARQALKPLVNTLENESHSWDILGTNLSQKLGENQWTSDTNRLILMDRKDFNKLGLGLDELIEGYIQTILATIAVDKMATKLLNKGKLKKRLFQSLNYDPYLIKEIVTC